MDDHADKTFEDHLIRWFLDKYPKTSNFYNNKKRLAICGEGEQVIGSFSEPVISSRKTRLSDLIDTKKVYPIKEGKVYDFEITYGQFSEDIVDYLNESPFETYFKQKGFRAVHALHKSRDWFRLFEGINQNSTILF